MQNKLRFVMAPKLMLALMLVLMLMSTQAMALGVGKIKTLSAFNQPFEGEIALLSLEPGELDSIKVALATPEEFSRANIDRTFLLSRLKFETMLKEDGKAAIRVFSQEAVTEPYLNFLVEVVWPKGRVVREFSVLLDVR